MSDEAGEKTFDPTPKRKKDAAEKGDVLRSKELGTAVAVLLGASFLKLGGGWLMGGLTETARSGFSFDRYSLDDFAPQDVLLHAMGAVLPPVFALGLMVLVTVVVSQLIFGEGRFVAKNIQPKGSRINPLSGLKRMFGPNGWIELAKGLGKLALLGSIAWWWGSSNIPVMLSLGRGEIIGQLALAWSAITNLMLLLSIGLVIIAMIDWPIQFVRRINRLKMTQQQVRDEHKQTEGSPEKKAAIRNKQRQLAKGGVRKAVGEAQFILTNPTHFAVAMTYDPAIAPAPVVLAKGRGEKALAMKELAVELGVPMLEYPALARSVYFTTRENQVIREELYAAIASVLAFVMSLKRGERPRRPEIAVPLEMRFDTEGRPQTA